MLSVFRGGVKILSFLMISFLPDFVDILMMIIAEKENPGNRNKLSRDYQKTQKK